MTFLSTPVVLPRISEPPALALVQASSRSWTGGVDLSCKLVNGIPVFIHTINCLRTFFTQTPIAIIAPAFDKNGKIKDHLAEYQLSDVEVFFGHDRSPLKRMVDITKGLSDETMVMRINGMNMFIDPRMVLDMCQALDNNPNLDCYKTSDDYPAALSCDFYKVAALRRALKMIPDEDEYHIHIKHFMNYQTVFNVESHTRSLYYTESELSRFKQIGSQIHQAEHTEVVDKDCIHIGDQLKFHYELAMQHIKPDSVILDIGSGTGYGSAFMAETAKKVIAGDLDEGAIKMGKNLYGHIANLQFAEMNAQKTDLPNSTIDYITSFETIEHVDDVAAYLAEFDRILKPGGLVFISTPQNCYGNVPLTYWHNIEFSYQELKMYIESQFDIIDFIGIKQGRIYFSGDPIGNNSFVIAKSRKKPKEYLTQIS